MNLLNLATQIACVSFSSGSAQTVIAAVTGNKVRVYAVYLSVSGTMNLTFSDGVNSDGPLPMVAGVPLVLAPKETGEPWYQTNAGGSFQITASSGLLSTVGRLYYTQVS